MLWNTDITYRIHKSPQPILIQINLFHVFPFHFLKIHFNIIIPSTPRSSKWTISLRFSHQTLYAPLLFPYVLHFPRTSFLFVWSPIQKAEGRDLHFSWNLMFVPNCPAYYLPLIQSAYCRYTEFTASRSFSLYANIRTDVSLCLIT